MRARDLACIACVALGACGPSADQSDSIERYLLEALTFARQTADTATIEEIFLPDAIYDDYPGQLDYRGVQEITGYLTSVHEWGDDVYMTLGRVQTSRTGAVAEWTLAAVQSRPIPDLLTTATNREVVVTGVTIIETQGGRIARAADYWDRADFILRLGGRIELPDGSVLQENP